MSSRLHNGHVRVLLPLGLVGACFDERDLSHFPRHASWNLYYSKRNQDQRTIPGRNRSKDVRSPRGMGGMGGTQVVVDMLRKTDSHHGLRKSSHVAEEPSKQENDGLRACERRHDARTTPTGITLMKTVQITNVHHSASCRRTPNPSARIQPPGPRNRRRHIHALNKTRYWLEVHWHTLGVR